MKKILLILLALSLTGVWTISAQDRPYAIVFYNVENLFDTIPNNVENRDTEFTPNGPKAWNTHKYNSKMKNLEKVFYNIAGTVKSFPAVIGVSEIENRSVLEDLVAMPKLAKANYQIAHYDSPDARGVDVAFLYRPDQFKYEGSYPIKTVVEDLPNFRTRDILSMWGTIEGERFCFMVCHWPSRLGGEKASEFRRIGAAKTIKHAVDSIMAERPDTKIVIMGDMNDDPTDRSMYEALGAKDKASKIKPGELFNPYYAMFKAGLGTLAYNDAWNLFDNMVVNENLLNATTGDLKLHKSKGDKFYGNIFRASYLIRTEGQYKGYPLRTYVGSNFQNGYSDHLPVYLLIAK